MISSEGVTKRLLAVFLLSLMTFAPLPEVRSTESVDHLLQVLSFAANLDNALDQIYPEAFPVIQSNIDLKRWEKEIVPYFAIEGVTDTSLPGSGLVWPEIVFATFTDPQEFSHLLAATDFLPPHTITVTDRILNPESAWFQRKDTVLVLIHELCHAQGILVGYEAWSQWDLSYDIEVSASLCALEIGAAMVASGNRKVLGPLLFQLRGMAIGAAEAIAIREHRVDYYQSAINEMLTGAEESSRDRSRRTWGDGPTTYEMYLHSYCLSPIERIFDVLDSDYIVEGLLLPINHMADMLNHSYAWSPYGYPTFPIEPVQRMPVRGLLIDDLGYVLVHVDDLVSS